MHALLVPPQPYTHFSCKLVQSLFVSALLKGNYHFFFFKKKKSLYIFLNHIIDLKIRKEPTIILMLTGRIIMIMLFDYPEATLFSPFIKIYKEE